MCRSVQTVKVLQVVQAAEALNHAPSKLGTWGRGEPVVQPGMPQEQVGDPASEQTRDAAGLP